MNARFRNDILELTVPERIQLIGELWDSIENVSEALPVTASQKATLDRRLEAYRSDPRAGSSWRDVRKRIQKRR
jgi:putative addiction module component (TIGR02574 family)